MPPTDQILKKDRASSNPNIEIPIPLSFSLCRKDKQLTLKKLVKLNQIVGFLSEKYNDVESEEVI